MVRVLSAIVLIAIVVATVWYAPPWVMVAVAALLAALGATELAAMSAKLGARVSPMFVAAAAAIVCAAFAAQTLDSRLTDLTTVLLALVVAAGVVTLSGGAPDAHTVQRAAVTFMAPLYLGLPFGAMAAIRASHGPHAFMVLFILLAVSDSAQYYTGRTFGRRKLAPAVSPAKTVEGAIGGFVAAAIVGGWLGSLWIPGVVPHVGALLGLGLAGVGIAGDLFESLLKRGAGVKDSSALIPGHGGVLDRVDSYLFAAPVYFVFLKYLG